MKQHRTCLPIRRPWAAVTMLALVLLAPSAWAAARVDVLAFELNDVTGLRAPQELKRTASLAPLLREALRKKGYGIVRLPPRVRRHADSSVGYLFAEPGAAAALGKRIGADWVIAGKLQKSSYLFAFITVRVIDVHTKRMIGEFNTRIEGPMTNQRLTRKGVQRIAQEVDAGIKAFTGDRRPSGDDLLAPGSF